MAVLNPAQFNLVPDANRVSSLVEQQLGNQQRREQSAELQPLRLEQQENTIQQQQQNIAKQEQEKQRQQQQQQFIQEDLLPVIQSESFIKKLAKIENSADQRTALKHEAGKAARAGNQQLATNYLELAADTDENIRLATTNFADTKKGLIQQGVVMGIPGVQNLLKSGLRKQGFSKGEQFITEEDGQKFLNTPIVDSALGEVRIDKQPVGTIVSKTTGETAEQKTQRLIREIGGKENAKMLAQIKNASTLEQQRALGRQADNFRSDLKLTEEMLSEINRAEEILEAGDAFTTGPIVGRLLSFRDAPQELASILKRLGVDRLSNFKGATSEKELAVAFEAGAAETLDKIPNLKRLGVQRRAILANKSRIQAELNELDSFKSRVGTGEKLGAIDVGGDITLPNGVVVKRVK